MNWRFAASVVCVLTSAALTGCISVQQKSISRDGAAALHGKTITVDAYETPSFAAMTPGKATFALIGAALMISEGNKFIRLGSQDSPRDLIPLLPRRVRLLDTGQGGHPLPVRLVQIKEGILPCRVPG